MRFLKIATAALCVGLAQFILCWRISILGVAPDLLLVFAAFAASGLRPVERIPVACCVGLWSDFLMGHRLGLMALGYGLGVWATEAIMPAASGWRRGRLGVWPSRAARAIGMTLMASVVAHGSVAVVARSLGDVTRPLLDLALRAGGIALYTAAVCPVAWLVLALTLGPVAPDAWRSRPRVVEG